MDSFVTDTQALVKFMLGKKVINKRSHQAYQSADKGESTIIIIEKYGSGIKRVMQSMAGAGSPVPVFEITLQRNLN